jgi:hypothetical protein
VTKLDWSKAKKRPSWADEPTHQERRRARDTARVAEHQQMEAVFDHFVAKHELSCVKCKKRSGPWAAARREPSGHRWALCKTCANKR